MHKLASQTPWRDAASLIIAAPCSVINSSKSLVDYNILYLKRTAKSSFPNAYVFPGGIVDEADKSSKWIEIFQSVDSEFCDNVSKEFFVRQNDGKRSPLFPGDEDSLRNGVLPNEVSFRICAIRESFEESGLLLLTSDVESRRNSSDSMHATSSTSLLSQDAVEDWRKKIHNDAFEFLNMCKELKRVPDIWSLKEWCEWLTPAFRKKRYDTVFYACCLKEPPSYYAHDQVETLDSVWRSPADILQMFISGKAVLAPPQILETLKILNFKTLEGFSTHINERALKGMRRTLTYFFPTNDGGVVQVLPGDDLYPEDEDELSPSNKKMLDLTLEELETSGGNKFRFLRSSYKPNMLPKFQCNVKLEYGQVAPVVITDGKLPDLSSAKL